MTKLDLFVLFGYLAGLLALGAILSSKIKNSEDMFAAGGQSPWWMAGISGYMTMFSSGTFVVWGGIAYNQGLVGVSILVMLGIAALLVGFFLAHFWKQLGVTTAAEYIEMRFGRAAVQFYSWFGMFVRMIGVGVALYAISKILCALLPAPVGSIFENPGTGHLAIHWAVILCGAIVIIYTIAGGMWAVLMADVLQFIVLMVSVIIVVPLILKEAGGLNHFLHNAPEHFFRPFSDEFTILFLVAWVVIHFFKIGGEWAFVQRFICVPDAKQAKKAAYIFGAMFIVSPFLWMIPPMAYRLINPAADHEQAYILACQMVLPAGMIGFLMASMFAATASMADSEINVFAGAFTREIYGRIINPEASEKKLVVVGRISTLVLGVSVILIALIIPHIDGGATKVIIKVTGMLVGPIVLPTIWGLFSKRIGQSSVWATAAVSLVLIIFFSYIAGQGYLLGESKIGFWTSAHRPIVDTWIIGIGGPVITLIIMEILGKGKVNAGYEKVQKVSVEVATKPQKSSSKMPQIILAYYMIAISILLTSIGITHQAGKEMIVPMGIALGVAGVLILSLTKKDIVQKNHK